MIRALPVLCKWWWPRWVPTPWASSLGFRALSRASATYGRKWGAQALLEIVSLDAATLYAKLVEVESPAVALLDMDDDGHSLSKTSASFMLTYRAHVLRVLGPLARHWRDVSPNHRFSFVRCMNGDHKQPRIVLLQRSARLSELSAAWIGAVIDLIAAYATDAAFNPDKQRRLHLVLDEFHQLGSLGRFQELLDVGRNKNASVIATLQDPNQLRLSYNRVGANNMIGRFATVIIGRMRPGEPSTEVSKYMIGLRTIVDTPEKPYKSDASSPSTKREIPLVRPEQLNQDLGVFDDKVHALVTGFGDILELTWPVTVWLPRQ
ncbi:type IV secretion system DNA-binding domain-containing protein [Rhodopseudomonas sp. BR0G17]|uniref:type IV secretion system DNA-binding domain-containing protein n=1 Tax=Rhodopseudomonas sp. BR0G17 TaxID=2269368 RepID=UPI0013DF3AD3